MEGKVVLGLDGGGTKTMTVCMDKEKNVIGQFTSACSNHNSVGPDLAREAIHAGIMGALSAAGKTTNDVAAITLGMSGVDRPADKEMVGKWIHDILPITTPLSIHNDATAALASGTGGRLYGIVVISGTGAISYGYGPTGESARAGGWGPTLGDQGAGYDIGQEVLRAVVRAKDGVDPPTLLTQALFSHLNLTKEDELIPWAYNKQDQGWQRVANIAAVAHQCARQKDPKAMEIIENTAKALLAYIKAVATRLKLPAGPESPAGGVPLVLAGGNLDHDDSLLADALVRLLATHLPGTRPARPTVAPAVGAALLALAHLA
jgi:N-acetylglucosamine kinase-like BadF-type ATPase